MINYLLKKFEILLTKKRKNDIIIKSFLLHVYAFKDMSVTG